MKLWRTHKVFHTYAHYKPQGGLFYIGKGSGDRAHQKNGRNAYWNRVVAKYGNPHVKILAYWDTEQEAMDHEVLLISCFKDMGYKLTNMSAGGDGCSGYKHTEEAKKKIQIARLGNKHGLGKVFSQTRRDKISAKLKNNKNCAGKRNGLRYQYIGTNLKTGEQIKVAGSIEIESAGFHTGHINDCAMGKQKSHKGYTWKKELIK